MKTMTLVLVVMMLTFAASGIAAGPSAGTTTYTVGSLAAPGVDTGMTLRKNTSVTVTATGSFCPGLGVCFGPGGTRSVDTRLSGFGGFVLPGAPAYGLVARVGSGPWVWVGSGPTTVAGVGDLVFAINDDLWSDNAGGFVVTVASSAKGSTRDCWPGWGYGDANHVHCGPPGQNKKQTDPATESSNGNSGDHGHNGGGQGGGKGH